MSFWQWEVRCCYPIRNAVCQMSLNAGNFSGLLVWLSSALFIYGEDPWVSAAIIRIRKQLQRWNGKLGPLWQPFGQQQRNSPSPQLPHPQPRVLSLHIVKNQGSDSSVASNFFCLKVAVKKKSSMGKEYRFLVLNESALIDLYLSFLLHL